MTLPLSVYTPSNVMSWSEDEKELEVVQVDQGGIENLIHEDFNSLNLRCRSRRWVLPKTKDTLAAVAGGGGGRTVTLGPTETSSTTIL